MQRRSFLQTIVAVPSGMAYAVRARSGELSRADCMLHFSVTKETSLADLDRFILKTWPKELPAICRALSAQANREIAYVSATPVGPQALRMFQPEGSDEQVETGSIADIVIKINKTASKLIIAPGIDRKALQRLREEVRCQVTDCGNMMTSVSVESIPAKEDLGAGRLTCVFSIDRETHIRNLVQLSE